MFFEPEISEWDGFVKAHPQSSVYHTSRWHRAIEKTYGFKTRYLALKGDSGIRAGIPVALAKGIFTRKLISYPFSDTCDPLTYCQDDFSELAACAQEFGKKQGATMLELRTCKFSYGPAQSESEYYAFELRLGNDEERLFNSLHRSCVQRAIKKARSSMKVVNGTAPSDLKAFYTLQAATRKRHGLPVQPYAFFKNLWDEFKPQDKIHILLTENSGGFNGGILLLIFKDILYAKYLASKRPETGQSQLLLWEAVRMGIRQGLQVLDLGRVHCSNKGLLAHKSRWTKIKIPCDYIRVPEKRFRINSESSLVSKASRQALRRMPSFALRLLGELFYKYLG